MAGCRGAAVDTGGPFRRPCSLWGRQLFSFQTQKHHRRVSEVIQRSTSWPPWVPLSVQGGVDRAGGLLRNLSVLGFHVRSRGAQWGLGSSSGAFSKGAGFGEGGAGGTQAPSPHPHHVDFTATACTVGFSIGFILKKGFY